MASFLTSVLVVGQLPVGHPQPPLLEVPLADALPSLGPLLHLPTERQRRRARTYCTAAAAAAQCYTVPTITFASRSTYWRSTFQQGHPHLKWAALQGCVSLAFA